MASKIPDYYRPLSSMILSKNQKDPSHRITYGVVLPLALIEAVVELALSILCAIAYVPFILLMHWKVTGLIGAKILHAATVLGQLSFASFDTLGCCAKGIIHPERAARELDAIRVARNPV